VEADLKRLAAKYVWWLSPEATLARPHFLLCQLMTLGTEDDVWTALDLVGESAFIEALKHAPPGVMDPKSWNFWHLVFHLPMEPLPSRPLPP
jgi:hypothetical protein